MLVLNDAIICPCGMIFQMKIRQNLWTSDCHSRSDLIADWGIGLQKNGIYSGYIFLNERTGNEWYISLDTSSTLLTSETLFKKTTLVFQKSRASKN